MLQSCYKTNYDETLDWVRAAGRGIALNRTSYHYNKTIWSYDGETDWQDLRHNREVGNWMGIFFFFSVFLGYYPEMGYLCTLLQYNYEKTDNNCGSSARAARSCSWGKESEKDGRNRPTVLVPTGI